METGGAISQCDGRIYSNLLAGNTADSGGAIGPSSAAAVYNNTLVGNQAARQGGGLYLCRGPIINCIAWQNSAPADAQLGECTPPTNCCIQGWTGDGFLVVTNDPQFVDADGADNVLLRHHRLRLGNVPETRAIRDLEQSARRYQQPLGQLLDHPDELVPGRHRPHRQRTHHRL